MLPAAWKKNDARARVLIIAVSVIVFGAIVALGRVKLDVQLGFDKHIFAKINAAINSTVSVLLLLD
jgi:putative membrane protein